MEKRPVYCVVGKIAAGKNFVCSILEKQGFFCIDGDVVIHKIIQEKQNEILAAFQDDAAKAGVSLQNADGTLNRRALGKLLFLHKELLAKQEGIVYPAFIARVEGMITSLQTTSSSSTLKALSLPQALPVVDAQSCDTQALAVVDAPHPPAVAVEESLAQAPSNKAPPCGVVINAAVLYKTPQLLQKCRAIFFVDAPSLVRFARIRRRDKLSPLEIFKRFWVQRDLFSEYKKFSREHGIQIIKITNWSKEGVQKKSRKNCSKCPIK